MSDNAPNLSIRARPRAVRRFSRKAIMGGSILLGTVMFGALAVALQSPNYDDETPDELYNVTHKPIADGLELLPKSYAEYKPVKPKLGPPLPGDLGAAYLASTDLPTQPSIEKPAVNTPKAKPARLASFPAPPPKQVVTVTAPVPVVSNEPESLFFSVGSGSNSNGGQFVQSANVGPSALPPPLSAFGLPQTPSFSPPSSTFDIGSIGGDQNQQARKEAFIEIEDSDIYNSHGLVSPRSPYQVMAGNLIPAALVTGLNSDLPGQVIGQVTENVYDTVTGNHLLIPQGARLMGRYDSVIAFGQSRALVVWTRLILPNGDSIQLDNLPGSDAQGFAGLKDRVDNHTWQFLKGAVLSSLLSIGAELASDDGDDSLTRALQNAGQDTANIAGQRIIERNLNVQPTLKVRPGWRFNVIVSRDLILKPYGDLP